MVVASKLTDGGPAFPGRSNQPVRYSGMDGKISGYTTMEPINMPGMSLRDWFAGQALAGLLAQSNGSATGSHKEAGARWAYEMADAMLAERSKP